jgi:hypothetical protein
MPLQYQSEVLDFISARCSEVQRSRCISCTVEVLRARIAQVDRVRVDHRACTFLRFVVNDSGTVQKKSVFYNGSDSLGQDQAAYFGPVEEMVSKDNPTKSFCLTRKDSSLSAASTSSKVAFLLMS